MLSDLQVELIYNTADALSHFLYNGFPAHAYFVCPVCHGKAELVRSCKLHGMARCLSCRIVMVRGKIPQYE